MKKKSDQFCNESLVWITDCVFNMAQDLIWTDFKLQLYLKGEAIDKINISILC